MAGWIAKMMTPKTVDGNEMFLGLSKSADLDLIQNCDLPPPMKVFTGSADKTVVLSMNRISGMMTQEDHENSRESNAHSYDKLELLKALRLSQTRAREAEKKAEKLTKEKECLSNALLAEAGELFSYRQWVRSLELEVIQLHSQLSEQEHRISVAVRLGFWLSHFVWVLLVLALHLAVDTCTENFHFRIIIDSQL